MTAVWSSCKGSAQLCVTAATTGTATACTRAFIGKSRGRIGCSGKTPAIAANKIRFPEFTAGFLAFCLKNTRFTNGFLLLFDVKNDILYVYLCI